MGEGRVSGKVLLALMVAAGFAIGASGFVWISGLLEAYPPEPQAEAGKESGAPRMTSAARTKTPQAPAQPPSVEDLKSLTTAPGSLKLSMENFYARIARAGDGIEVADASRERHEYLAWKFAGATGNKTYSFKLRVRRPDAPAAAMLLTIRFVTLSGVQDHECLVDPAKGTMAVRGAAKPDALTVNVEPRFSTIRCHGKSPPGTTEVRVHFAPAVGLHVGSLDPASTGALVVAQMSVSEL